MICEELASLVMQNRDSISFLVGNGINNYEQREKYVSGKVDWKELIRTVRDNLAPCFEIEDNNLPEKFDSIVREKDKVDFERSMPINIDSIHKIDSIVKDIRFDAPILYKSSADCASIS